MHGDSSLTPDDTSAVSISEHINAVVRYAFPSGPEGVIQSCLSALVKHLKNPLACILFLGSRGFNSDELKSLNDIAQKAIDELSNTLTYTAEESNARYAALTFIARIQDIIQTLDKRQRFQTLYRLMLKKSQLGDDPIVTVRHFFSPLLHALSSLAGQDIYSSDYKKAENAFFDSINESFFNPSAIYRPKDKPFSPFELGSLVALFFIGSVLITAAMPLWPTLFIGGIIGLVTFILRWRYPDFLQTQDAIDPLKKQEDDPDYLKIFYALTSKTPVGSPCPKGAHAWLNGYIQQFSDSLEGSPTRKEIASALIYWMIDNVEQLPGERQSPSSHVFFSSSFSKLLNATITESHQRQVKKACAILEKIKKEDFSDLAEQDQKALLDKKEASLNPLWDDLIQNNRDAELLDFCLEKDGIQDQDIIQCLQNHPVKREQNLKNLQKISGDAHNTPHLTHLYPSISENSSIRDRIACVMAAVGAQGLSPLLTIFKKTLMPSDLLSNEHLNKPTAEKRLYGEDIHSDTLKQCANIIEQAFLERPWYQRLWHYILDFFSINFSKTLAPEKKLEHLAQTARHFKQKPSHKSRLTEIEKKRKDSSDGLDRMKKAAWLNDLQKIGSCPHLPFFLRDCVDECLTTIDAHKKRNHHKKSEHNKKNPEPQAPLTPNPDPHPDLSADRDPDSRSDRPPKTALAISAPLTSSSGNGLIWFEHIFPSFFPGTWFQDMISDKGGLKKTLKSFKIAKLALWNKKALIRKGGSAEELSNLLSAHQEHLSFFERNNNTSFTEEDSRLCAEMKNMIQTTLRLIEKYKDTSPLDMLEKSDFLPAICPASLILPDTLIHFERDGFKSLFSTRLFSLGLLSFKWPKILTHSLNEIKKQYENKKAEWSKNVDQYPFFISLVNIIGLIAHHNIDSDVFKSYRQYLVSQFIDFTYQRENDQNESAPLLIPGVMTLLTVKPEALENNTALLHEKNLEQYLRTYKTPLGANQWLFFMEHMTKIMTEASSGERAPYRATLIRQLCSTLQECFSCDFTKLIDPEWEKILRAPELESPKVWTDLQDKKNPWIPSPKLNCPEKTAPLGLRLHAMISFIHQYTISPICGYVDVILKKHAAPNLPLTLSPQDPKGYQFSNDSTKNLIKTQLQPLLKDRVNTVFPPYTDWDPRGWMSTLRNRSGYTQKIRALSTLSISSAQDVVRFIEQLDTIWAETAQFADLRDIISPIRNILHQKLEKNIQEEARNAEVYLKKPENKERVYTLEGVPYFVPYVFSQSKPASSLSAIVATTTPQAAPAPAP